MNVSHRPYRGFKAIVAAIVVKLLWISEAGYRKDRIGRAAFSVARCLARNVFPPAAS